VLYRLGEQLAKERPWLDYSTVNVADAQGDFRLWGT